MCIQGIEVIVLQGKKWRILKKLLISFESQVMDYLFYSALQEFVLPSLDINNVHLCFLFPSDLVNTRH